MRRLRGLCGMLRTDRENGGGEDKLAEPIPIAVTDQIVRQQERIDALEVALRRLLLAAENAYRMPDDTDGELAAAIEAGKDTMPETNGRDQRPGSRDA